MSPTEACMLFAPPLPPIWIPRTRTVVLGRGASCDLAVASRGASRRHAAVRFDENGDVVVEDLDSTNGTRVDGERVEGVRRLSPGEVIQVGGVNITFCRVDERFAEVSASDSTARMTPHSEDGHLEPLRGDLSQVPIYVVLQMLESGSKTGLLEVVTAKGPSRFWFKRGRPVHAESSGCRGPVAAFDILGLPSGRFTFLWDEPAPSRSLTGSITQLLLEYSRLNDEATMNMG